MGTFAALGGIRQTHARWLHWVESQVLDRDSSHLTPRLTLDCGGWRDPRPILLEALSCGEVDRVWPPWLDRTEQQDSGEWAGVKNEARNFPFTCLQLL